MNSSIFSSSVLFNYNYTIHWKVDKRNKKIKGKTAKSDDISVIDPYFYIIIPFHKI